MFESTVLENGLRVITEEIPRARSTSIGVLVDANPQLDPSGKEGLAHFVEHGLFLGTTGRDAKAISAMIDEAGGQMGAFTSRDYTCFYTHVMDDYGPFAWELLGDILLNSTFPEPAVNRERDVILQELSLLDDDHSARIHDALKSQIWGDHPLGREVAGKPHSVEQLTRQDIKRFVADHYTPDRMIVAAAGAAPHQIMVEQARDAFWRLEGTSVRSELPPCDFRSVVHYEHREVGQVYFNFAFPARKYTCDERYAIHALNAILAGGMSSRLYGTLRENLGLVYYIHSQYYAYRDAGVIMVEGVTASDKIDQVLQSVLLEIDRLAQEGLEEDELWRTKKQMKGQQMLTADSLSTRMSRLLTQGFYFGRPISEDEILQSIDQLEAAPIQEEAGRLLSAEGIGVGIVGSDAADETQNRIAETLAQLGISVSPVSVLS